MSESRRRKERAASIEAIGTFSVGVASGLIPLSEEAKVKLSAAQSQGAIDMVKAAQREYSDAMTLATPIHKS